MLVGSHLTHVVKILEGGSSLGVEEGGQQWMRRRERVVDGDNGRRSDKIGIDQLHETLDNFLIILTGSSRGYGRRWSTGRRNATIGREENRWSTMGGRSEERRQAMCR